MPTRIASQRFMRVCDSSAILRAKTSLLIIVGRLASTTDCLRLQQIATGGEPAALAAKSATSTIPIVFAIGGDPIKLGLVASYNRPGGNATGANILAAEMDGKRLELLHELMPNAARVGLLLNPNFPAYPTQLNELQQAATIMGLQVDVLRANTD